MTSIRDTAGVKPTRAELTYTDPWKRRSCWAQSPALGRQARSRLVDASIRPRRRRNRYLGIKLPRCHLVHEKTALAGEMTTVRPC